MQEQPRNEGVTLYRASPEAYQPGDVIGPIPAGKFHLRREDDLLYAQLDAKLEAGRPQHAPSRRSAIYSFGCVSQCFDFYAAEQRSGNHPEDYTPKGTVHRVEALEEAFKAPYVLANHAYKLLALRRPISEIVVEYWSPRQPWKVWEYLALRMRVLAGPEDTSEMIYGASLVHLKSDKAVAKRIWPLQ